MSLNPAAIAAQLYTLRDVLKTPEQVASSLKRVRDIGYRAVQVSGLGPIAPERLLDITASLELTICATHVGYEELTDHLDDVIRTHKLWGCDYIGLGMLPERYRDSRAGYEAFIAEFTSIGQKLEASGLHLVYHNHNIEFVRFGDVTGMDLLFAGAQSGAYSLELDTYWVQAGGAHPAEQIRRAKDHIKVVHLKDMAVQGWTPVFAEIGAGNLNWSEILAACESSGVEWYVIEQDVCQQDPFDSLAQSLHWLEAQP